MKNVSYITFLTAILCILAACNRVEKGQGNMLYTMHDDKSGPAIGIGELVEMTAIEKTAEDSVLWNSADYGRTALITRQPSVFAGDLFAALGKLSKGDSATVKISIDSMVAYMGEQKPPTKGKYLTYTLKIVNVIPKGNLTDSAYKQTTGAFLQERMEQIRNNEAITISNYIAARKLNMAVTNSGLHYAVTVNGTGATAYAGDTVAIHYTATLLSGKVVDATRPAIARKAGIESPSGEPRELVAGVHSTIAGLEESLLLFPAGTKATVIIPAALAFGATGYEDIQPYTPLVYELEVVRVGRLTGKRPVEAGASMPGFSLTNMANDVILQKEDLQKGKSMIVLFSTDCEHCQHQVQEIGKRYDALAPVNLYFVSQEERPAIEQFMQRYGRQLYGKKNVTVLQDMDHQFAGIFQAVKYPSVYVYSAQKKLIRYFGGQTHMEDIIKAVKYNK